jgi:Protein of unknown function (DUF3168)
MILPDVERLVSSYLRAHPDVAALVVDRVYTAFPREAVLPLALVQRIGGVPPLSHPLVVDEAQLQVDAYADGKAAAWELLTTLLAAFDELEGAVLPEGSIAAVRQGAIRYEADETFTPSKPRYLFDVLLTTRPAVAAARRPNELGAVATVAVAPT